eukprot:g5032.t1
MKVGGGTSRLGRKNWRKRWFQIDLLNNVLIYYTAPGGELKGGVSLTNARVTESYTYGEFHVTPSSAQDQLERTYHLRALDAAQLQEWLASLQQASKTQVASTLQASRERRGAGRAASTSLKAHSWNDGETTRDARAGTSTDWKVVRLKDGGEGFDRERAETDIHGGLIDRLTDVADAGTFGDDFAEDEPPMYVIEEHVAAGPEQATVESGRALDHEPGASDGESDGGQALSSQWEEVYDDATQAVYYYNSATEQTSWERPPGFPAGGDNSDGEDDVTDDADGSGDDGNSSSGDEDGDDATSPQAVEVLVTEETAVVEAEVGGFAANGSQPLVAKQDAENEAEWTEHVDDATGDVYYYNTRTQETSWDPPPAGADDDADEEEDDDEWEEYLDEDSGEIYYSNRRTGETSWDVPPGWVASRNGSFADGDEQADGAGEQSADSGSDNETGDETDDPGARSAGDGSDDDAVGEGDLVASTAEVVEVVMVEGESAAHATVEPGDGVVEPELVEAGSLDASFENLKRSSIACQRNSVVWAPWSAGGRVGVGGAHSHSPLPPALVVEVSDAADSEGGAKKSLRAGATVVAAVSETFVTPRADRSILQRSAQCGFPFPSVAPRIFQACGADDAGSTGEQPVFPVDEVVEHANSTRPLAHTRTRELLLGFLEHKLARGSDAEQICYSRLMRDVGGGTVECDVGTYLTRLLTCRPLSFHGKRDQYRLKDGSRGLGGFELVGSDRDAVLLKGKLALEHLLSFDE